jgi:hypothetical protein
MNGVQGKWRGRILVVEKTRYRRERRGDLKETHYYCCGPVRSSLQEAMNDADTLAKALAKTGETTA